MEYEKPFNNFLDEENIEEDEDVVDKVDEVEDGGKVNIEEVEDDDIDMDYE